MISDAVPDRNKEVRTGVRAYNRRQNPQSQSAVVPNVVIDVALTCQRVIVTNPMTTAAVGAEVLAS